MLVCVCECFCWLFVLDTLVHFHLYFLCFYTETYEACHEFFFVLKVNIFTREEMGSGGIGARQSWHTQQTLNSAAFVVHSGREICLVSKGMRLLACGLSPPQDCVDYFVPGIL